MQPAPLDRPASSDEAEASTHASTSPHTRDPVLAGYSLPSGLHPLTVEEAQEAEANCGGLSNALDVAIRGDKSDQPPAELVLEALKRDFSVPGVDVPRCRELISRDVLTFRVRAIESEAINNIRLFSVGLAAASTAGPATFCRSAGPSV
jgi:hypothetical protein